MDALGDMDLFVRVVNNNGLAAAGREVGLSPARMTARMNYLEARYGVRLLNRTTRKVSLTEEGQQFYASCRRVLAEFQEAEHLLQKGKVGFSGALKVTAPRDVGQKHIEPLLTKFANKHPQVAICLDLNDGVASRLTQDFDIAIRYGVLDDSNLVARRLLSSHRVLCASPKYLKKHGTPRSPEQLKEHNCLAMVRAGEPLTTWYFKQGRKTIAIPVEPSRTSNDGAVIKRWVLQGNGISLKSHFDVAAEIKANKLITVLDDYHPDFARKGVQGGADLYAVYQSRDFLPERIRAFIDELANYFEPY